MVSSQCVGTSKVVSEWNFTGRNKKIRATNAAPLIGFDSRQHNFAGFDGPYKRKAKIWLCIRAHAN
jgi:hypothetical protein